MFGAIAWALGGRKPYRSITTYSSTGGGELPCLGWKSKFCCILLFCVLPLLYTILPVLLFQTIPRRVFGVVGMGGPQTCGYLPQPATLSICCVETIPIQVVDQAATFPSAAGCGVSADYLPPGRGRHGWRDKQCCGRQWYGDCPRPDVWLPLFPTIDSCGAGPHHQPSPCLIYYLPVCPPKLDYPGFVWSRRQGKVGRFWDLPEAPFPNPHPTHPQILPHYPII